jgi:2-polyprenyl-3-methyl-5-hydroxy-6-metoxy-1,4-benzoquinol methylase
MGFFDRYPEFLEPTRTGASRNRLDKRHEAIFATRPEIFLAATVLDIASHDGRWSFAAVKGGSSHVTGVEARPHLVAAANKNLAALGISPASYRFVQADIFDYLRQGAESFDVVLCLGFFYHTYRHPELLTLIKRRRPKHLIVDSQVTLAEGPTCAVTRDRVDFQGEAAAEETSYKGYTYAATPSAALLRDMLIHYDFKVEAVDWTKLKGEILEGIEDYAEGRRVTFVCEAR